MNLSAGTFATTHWSVVLATGRSDAANAGLALESLYRTYWYPLYCYVRRKGRSPEDAQDLTQQFFTHLLSRHCLELADPARGRFRTFLLHALDHFLINDWKHGRRLKRGGGAPHLSLDAERAEHRYSHEPVTSLTPAVLYERQWATALLDRVLAELRKEYETTDRSALFAELAERMWGKDGAGSFLEIGRRLGLSEGAARGAMHRLRERFRERLRGAVAETLADPAELEPELRHLLAVVSGTE